MSLSNLLDLVPRIRALGEREALRYDDGFRSYAWSYKDLYRKIAGAYSLFQQQGVSENDHVLLWGPNRVEWIAAFWGILLCRARVVTVDSRSTPEFVARIVQETRPVLLVQGDEQDTGSIESSCIPFSRLDAKRSSHLVPLPDASPDDIAEIVYTSGTTGEPKGIVHRHRNLCANLRPLDREMGKYRSFVSPFQPLRLLNLLPLSHMFGQSLGLFIPVLLGGSCVLTNQLAPGRLIWTIRKNRVTALIAVPRQMSQIIAALSRTLPSATGSSLRRLIGALSLHKSLGWKFWAVVVGGARLDPELEAWWVLRGVLCVQGYGLTEASPIVALNHPFKTRMGSLGVILEGQEARIGPEGEIQVRGENITTDILEKGKYKSLRRLDQWLDTGDLGEMDREGRLYFRGRKKDLIVTSDGMNIYPEDVEKVLNRQPQVQDSVVVGIHRNSGEQVHAVLMMADEEADAGELVRQTNRVLEPYQRIKGWTRWQGADFPRTASTGKIKRFEVARRVQEQAGEEVLNAGGDPVSRAISGLSGLSLESLNDDLDLAHDLGFSSLDRIELLSALEEELGTDLPEQELIKLSTVQELREWVKEKTGMPEAGPVHTAGMEEPAKSGKPSGKGTDRAGSSRNILPGPPRWNRTKPVALVRSIFLNSLIIPEMRLLMQVRPAGLEKLDDLEPPVLFAANHTSHLDVPAILSALPRFWRNRVAPAMLMEHFEARFRPERAAARKRLFDRFQYLFACAMFNGYPLPQTAGSLRSSILYSGELCDFGYCPVIFPEGTMTRDGKIQPFMRGIGYLAINLKVPVVPLCINGLYEAFPYSAWLPYPGSVRVTLGSPVLPDPSQDAVEVTSRVQASVLNLAGSHSGTKAFRQSE